MSFFSRYNKAPKEDAVAPPERGISRYWHIIKTHTIKLMVMSFVFTLTSLAVVTIPASIAGMCHVCVSLEKGDHLSSWIQEYFYAFLGEFMDRLLAWIASISVPAIVYVALAYAGVESAACIGVFLALWLLLRTALDWFVAMYETMNLGFWKNLKNAFLLFMIEWKRSLLIMLSFVVVMALIWFLFPYCFLFLSFFGFAARTSFSANLIVPVVADRLGGVW